MLQKIDVHLVDHCNLNCRSCTHFSSLAEEFFLNPDAFEKDMTRLSKLTHGNIGEIYLLGGEPLLHPEVSEFFPITRNLFRNSKIIVITNGILLAMQEEKFWKACRRSDVEIWISVYDELKINYTLIQQKAGEYGVTIMYTSTAKDNENRKLWTKYKLDIEGKQNWVNSFCNCAIRNCVTLKKGKLYTCPTMAHIEHFNKQFNLNLQPTEFDYVDIYKVESHEGLLSALVKPVSFCRYCKTKEYESCFWERTKKELSEWT